MAFYILINLVVLGLLAWLIWRKDKTTFRKIFWPALLFKLLMGIWLGYVYSYQYTDSDTVLFFESSVELSQLARENPGAYLSYLWSESHAPYSGENRTLFFVKLVSVFALITGDNYWIVSLYFSFISLVSAWWLTATISRQFPSMTWPAVAGFLVFPSCVFWSSGVIKETMAVAALYGLAATFLQVWMKSKVPVLRWIMAVFCIWLVWNLKYYYVAVFLSVAVTAVLTRWFVEHRMRPSVRSFYREVVLFTVLLMVMFFVVTFVHPNFYPQRILEVIVENYYLFMDASGPGKAIHFYNLEPTLWSLLINSPWAIVSGLFRPFIWEATTFFQVLVSIENLVLAFLSILAFQHIKKISHDQNRILLWALLIYCLLLCALLTLSAPNFGTLVRYRIGFLPFFVFLISYQSILVKRLEKLFGV